MGELAEKLAGKFIVIDGPDGAGKSTQLQMLKEYLQNEGQAVEIVIDPGGTKTGQKIREILLGRDTEPISPACETLLFMASRAQLVHEKVRPALKAGKVVLGDRFISATMAYQGALGVDTNEIIGIAHKAVGDTWPELTIILDLSAEEGIARAGAERMKPKEKKRRTAGQLGLFGDRMESRAMDYHALVRDNFLALGKKTAYPRPVVHLDATGSPDEVGAKVWGALQRHFAND